MGLKAAKHFLRGSRALGLPAEPACREALRCFLWGNTSVPLVTPGPLQWRGIRAARSSEAEGPSVASHWPRGSARSVTPGSVSGRSSAPTFTAPAAKPGISHSTCSGSWSWTLPSGALAGAPGVRRTSRVTEHMQAVHSVRKTVTTPRRNCLVKKEFSSSPFRAWLCQLQGLLSSD